MVMKKLINRTEDIVKELMEGLVKSHSDLIQLAAPDIIIRKKPKAKGKITPPKATALPDKLFLIKDLTSVSKPATKSRTTIAISEMISIGLNSWSP